VFPAQIGPVQVSKVFPAQIGPVQVSKVFPAQIGPVQVSKVFPAQIGPVQVSKVFPGKKWHLCVSFSLIITIKCNIYRNATKIVSLLEKKPFYLRNSTFILLYT
jgi:hypothetical protein